MDKPINAQQGAKVNRPTRLIAGFASESECKENAIHLVNLNIAQAATRMKDREGWAKGNDKEQLIADAVRVRVAKGTLTEQTLAVSIRAGVVI